MFFQNRADWQDRTEVIVRVCACEDHECPVPCSNASSSHPSIYEPWSKSLKPALELFGHPGFGRSHVYDRGARIRSVKEAVLVLELGFDRLCIRQHQDPGIHILDDLPWGIQGFKMLCEFS